MLSRFALLAMTSLTTDIPCCCAPSQPDAYYFTYLGPGERPATGDWTASELEELRHLANEHFEKASAGLTVSERHGVESGLMNSIDGFCFQREFTRPANVDLILCLKCRYTRVRGASSPCTSPAAPVHNARRRTKPFA